MYEYRCKVVRVIDGDTVDVDIDLGFLVYGLIIGKKELDCMVLTHQDLELEIWKKKYGLAAKEFLTKMLDDEGGIILKTHKDAEGKVWTYSG